MVYILILLIYFYIALNPIYVCRVEKEALDNGVTMISDIRKKIIKNDNHCISEDMTDEIKQEKR